MTLSVALCGLFCLFLAVFSRMLTAESDNLPPEDEEDDLLQKPVHETKTKTLFIGGIFPMAGSWAGGKGCRPAVDIALEDVNSRKDILPGYKLEMLANDSQVGGFD